MFTQNTKSSNTPMPEKHVSYRYVAEAGLLEDEELGRYVSFGIRAIRVEETSVALIPDISTELEDVQRLAELCTLRELEPEHLEDVIEDFLNHTDLELI